MSVRFMKNFPRITVDHEQMGDVPCIRGLRIPVATVVGMVADGMDESEILEAYPDLKREDIEEALRYTSAGVVERAYGAMKASPEIVRTIMIEEPGFFES